MTEKPGRAPAIVEARNLVKMFPGVVALPGMNFELHAGEVHCVVGETVPAN